MTNEKEELESLLHHPAWLRLVNEENQWWQQQLASQLESCANDKDDAAALNKMRQLIAAKKAVERFMARPKEHLSVARVRAEQAAALAEKVTGRGGYHA